MDNNVIIIIQVLNITQVHTVYIASVSYCIMVSLSNYGRVYSKKIYSRAFVIYRQATAASCLFNFFEIELTMHVYVLALYALICHLPKS